MSSRGHAPFDAIGTLCLVLAAEQSGRAAGGPPTLSGFEHLAAGIWRGEAAQNTSLNEVSARVGAQDPVALSTGAQPSRAMAVPQEGVRRWRRRHREAHARRGRRRRRRRPAAARQDQLTRELPRYALRGRHRSGRGLQRRLSLRRRELVVEATAGAITCNRNPDGRCRSTRSWSVSSVPPRRSPEPRGPAMASRRRIRVRLPRERRAPAVERGRGAPDSGRPGPLDKGLTRTVHGGVIRGQEAGVT